MSDWFTQNAPKPAAGSGDWFAQHAPGAVPPPAAEKSVGGFVSNVASSAGQFAKDVAAPILHPQQTLEGVTGLFQGMAEKSGFKPANGVSHEQNVDALVKHYKERYGSWDGFKNALYTDPVGIAADFSTLAGGVGAGFKGAELAANAGKLGTVADIAGTSAKVAAKASEFTDPLRLAGKVVGKTAKLAGKTADATATSLTRGALRGGFNVDEDAAKVTGAVEAAQAVVPGFSRKGLDKITAGLKDLQAQKEAGAATGARAGITIDPAAVERRLDEVMNRRGMQVNPDADLKQIEKVRQNFRNRTGGVPIPADEAQALKEGTYANNKYGKAAPPQVVATVESEKALARGLKEELETQIPALAGLNAAQAKLLDLQGILTKAVNKHTNSGGFWGNLGRQTISSKAGAMKTSVIIGAGALAHEPAVAAAVTLTQAILSDPAVKMRLANAINTARRLNPAKYGTPGMRAAAATVADYAAKLATPLSRLDDPGNVYQGESDGIPVYRAPGQ